MVCRTAYLIRTPVIEEITESKKTNWVNRKWVSHYEPALFPEYVVTFVVDYGTCCGVDDVVERFTTREAAQAAIDDVLAGNSKYIKYDPVRIYTDD